MEAYRSSYHRERERSSEGFRDKEENSMHNFLFVHKQHDFLGYQGDDQILSSEQAGTFLYDITLSDS